MSGLFLSFFVDYNLMFFCVLIGLLFCNSVAVSGSVSYNFCFNLKDSHYKTDRVGSPLICIGSSAMAFPGVKKLPWFLDNFVYQKFQCPAGQTCKVQYVPCVMPKCKDAIAVNRPTCVKDPNGTCTLLHMLQIYYMWNERGGEGSG